MPKYNAFILGGSLIIGLSLFGLILGNNAIRYKEYERTVTVKGLSERDYKADIVIWPIQFSLASNSLDDIYKSMDDTTKIITSFLKDSGIEEKEISYSSLGITDKFAQQYGDQNKTEFRYTTSQTVIVYSKNIDTVQNLMEKISDLGKQGIVFTNQNYDSKIEYIFDRLNQVKPAMIEEATKDARGVAEKFASDSKSQLGKIKSASQGQFSITDRDKNNPHIKKVRVVSTVAYYLLD